jgi:hypothetical protein
MQGREFDAYLRLLSRFLRLGPRERASLERELRAHVAEALQDALSRGRPREQALAEILDDFGDAAALAARFGSINRKRRWMMRGTLAAAALGFLAITMSHFSGEAKVQAGLPDDGPARALKSVASDADAATRAFQRVADVQFEDKPLSDVFAWFEETSSANVVVEWQSLEGAGVLRDAPVTLRLRGMTLEKLLEFTLASLGAHLDVDFAVTDNVVLISTRAAVAARHTVEVYDVRELLRAMLKHATPPSAEPAGDAVSKGGSAEAALVQLVQEMVAPNSWADAGGAASLRAFHGSLVVRNSAAAQRQIRKLLADLSAVVPARSE